VTGHTLTNGDDDFHLTATDEVFTVAMTEDANLKEDTYHYTVTTAALGDASTTTSGQMVIAKVCVASLEGGF
jgi:hypothetical protein